MKKPLLASIVMHIVLITAILIDLPIWTHVPKNNPKENIVFVDLSKIKIAEISNLPKTKEKKATQTNKTNNKKNEPKTVKIKNKPKTKRETTKTKKTDATLENNQKNNEKKQSQVQKQDKSNNEIKSLLASVEKIKENIQKEADPENQNDKNKGISGGNEGSYNQILSISEKDLISAKLRACWSLDPGVKNVDDIIVEVETILSPEGQVNAVQIVDTYKYNNDAAFRAIAESARRAVLICGKMNEESPFVLLAKRHPDKYNSWKNMRLFFNPLDGGVN